MQTTATQFPSFTRSSMTLSWRNDVTVAAIFSQCMTGT
jgi:hypothetical protein